MCGRTACTLNPDQLAKATRYCNSKGELVNPKWRHGDQDKYKPSYNKAPMSYCPVLLHRRNLLKDKDCQKDPQEGNDRMIVAMKWGLIPSWVKDVDNAQYKMNNARSDTMLTKASYKRPLERGQRCVVLADGFYEWNTSKSEKQPYYIFFKESEPEQSIVTMAGIFESRKSDENLDDLFSFSVITVDAHPQLSWLHHRMPAMLETEEEVSRWLDSGSVSLEEAVKLIKPKDCLAWYPVSKVVNNSRNNFPECKEKVDLEKVKAKGGSESKTMLKWLTGASKPLKKGIRLQKSSPVKTEGSPKKGAKRKSGEATMMDSWLKKEKK